MYNSEQIFFDMIFSNFCHNPQLYTVYIYIYDWCYLSRVSDELVYRFHE